MLLQSMYFGADPEYRYWASQWSCGPYSARCVSAHLGKRRLAANFGYRNCLSKDQVLDCMGLFGSKRLAFVEKINLHWDVFFLLNSKRYSLSSGSFVRQVENLQMNTPILLPVWYPSVPFCRVSRAQVWRANKKNEIVVVYLRTYARKDVQVPINKGGWLD